MRRDSHEFSDARGSGPTRGRAKQALLTTPFQLSTQIYAHGSDPQHPEFAVYLVRSDWHPRTQQYLFAHLTHVGTFRDPIDAASHAAHLQRLIR